MVNGKVKPLLFRYTVKAGVQTFPKYSDKITLIVNHSIKVVVAVKKTNLTIREVKVTV